MSKKRRNKQYRGKDASSQTRVVTRVSVPSRSGPGRWWHEHRKRIVRWLRIIGITLVFYGLLSWIF